MSLNDYFWNIFINKGTCQLEFKDAFSRTNLFSLHRKNPIRDKDLYYKRFKKQKNKRLVTLLFSFSHTAAFPQFNFHIIYIHKEICRFINSQENIAVWEQLFLKIYTGNKDS